MGQGQGSVTVNQRRPPAGGGGTLTGAENGLSVNALVNAVLGNDENDLASPAELLNNREIVDNGFTLLIKDAVTPGTTELLRLNSVLVQLTGSGAASRSMRVVDQTDILSAVLNASGGAGVNLLLANLGGTSNQSPSVGLITQSSSWAMEALTTDNHFEISETLTGFDKRFLLFDSDNNRSLIGDTDDIFNGTKLIIDDNQQNIEAGTSAGLMLSLDQGTGNFQLGDLSNVLSGMRLLLYGLSSGAVISDAQGQYLDLSPSSGLYQIGDVAQTNNGLYLEIDDAGESFLFRAGFNLLMWLDQSAGEYKIGDINGNTKGLRMFIDDNNDIVDFSNTALTATLSINGNVGFTGTVTPVTSITVVGGLVTAVS